MKAQEQITPLIQSSVDNKEDLRMVYNAIVDYHNNLAQIRFTVAGIFLATNGFLASVAIQGQESLIWFVLSFLGVLIAVICWFLDTRNYQLLENLGTRGNEIEKSLGIKDNQSFFYLMAVQPIEPRVMPTFKEMKKITCCDIWSRIQSCST